MPTIKIKNRKIKPIRSAPEYLVDAYKTRYIKVGRSLVKRLLEDSRMLHGWPEIIKAIESKNGNYEWWYRRITNSIAHAKRKSETLTTRRTRGEERDQYLKIADDFDSIIQRITDKPLNVPSIELLDEEIQSIFTTGEIDVFNYVYTPELLQGMARLARKLADNAMNKSRPDERVEASGKKTPKQRPEERMFVWHLSKDFKTYFDKSMYGTTAKIANVVFDTTDNNEITKEFVRSATANMNRQSK
jgi:hypothetical protein